MISIQIRGTKATACWDALVDFGADETLLPLALADLLGVELDERMISEAAGISGDRLKIQFGSVEFQLMSGNELVTWTTAVGFVDFGTDSDEVIILGHGGCLDFFTATFDGELAELELVPNSLLPR